MEYVRKWVLRDKYFSSEREGENNEHLSVENFAANYG